MKCITAWIQTMKNMQLARKLILIQFFLILIPLGVLAFYAYSSFMKAMEKNVGEFQLQTLKQVTLNIDTYMNELIRLTLMPYQYPDILTYLESVREPGQPLTLEEIDHLNSFVTQVFLNGRIDIMGVALYGAHGASYVVLPESQYITTYKLDGSADWLQQLQGGDGKPLFIPTHSVQSTSGTRYDVFSIARELRSFDTGATLGYIVIDIDPASVQHILSQVRLGDQESIYIADQSGNPVIRKQSQDPIDSSLELALFESPEGVSHLGRANGSLLAAHVTSPVTGWRTVGIVPVSELMKDSVMIRNSMMLFGMLCVGLAMIASVIIAFRITKPLRKLSRLMRKVEQGDLHVAFPVKQWDEVGHLGHAFNMMVSRLSELAYLLYETEIREKDAQIAALQSKINPHFLYNTLGSISMYAEVSGNREIVMMANNLSRLLRYSLSGNKESVTLRDELEHVKGYMTIQKMRYEERIDFRLEAEEEVLNCRVIPLMIQPIVENAVNHALDKGVGEGRIQIRCRRKDQVLIVTVEDDGIGLNNEELETLRRRLQSCELGGQSGNGLLNVHRRILLHFGEPYGLRIESMPYQGLRIIMELPVRKG